MPRIARIVSGGQTGVDRGALDAAVAAGVAYGGWCPRDGWAEDRPEAPGLLADYPLLREAPSTDPAERTRLNVRDSVATLVIRVGPQDSPGTDLTIATATRLRRPLLVSAGDEREALAWVRNLGSDLVLNVAGPRESEQPGSYLAARRLVAALVR